jgi:type I restriction enzyme M protein
VLTPGRYVGAADVADDGEPIAEKIARLQAELLEEFDEGRRLEQVLRARLNSLAP